MRLLGCTALGIAVLVAIGFASDYASRYFSWQALSKRELLRAIPKYLERNNIEAGHACLYVVDCSDGRARLKLIHDLDAWDIESSKEDIWKRRFESSFCEGYTANFGLHLIPSAATSGPADHHARPVWSFVNDRFIVSNTNHLSASFSEEPWERCTPEKAVWHAVP